MDEGRPEHRSHIEDPGKAARSASGIPIVPAFDGYRALAIVGVVLLHVLGVSEVIGTGDTGFLHDLTFATVGRAVEVLFVISGFVVFLPTVARKGNFGDLKGYAIRRGARLLPAYWMVLAIIVILRWTVDAGVAAPSPDLESIAIHFAGLQVPLGLFIPGIPMGFGVNAPVWTLSVEIMFYVVLPLVASRYFRHPLIGLALALGITVAWDAAFDHVADIASLLDADLSFNEAVRLTLSSKLQLMSWAFSFGLGMTGAWVYVRYREAASTAKGRVLAIQAVSLAALATFAWIVGGAGRGGPSILMTTGFSLSLGTFMIATALGPRALQLPFANPVVRRLGDISYGVYLSHLVIMTYLAELTSLPRDGTAGDFFIWLAAVLPLAILYGYLSARFLEQPVRRWARRFGRRAEPQKQ